MKGKTIDIIIGSLFIATVTVLAIGVIAPSMYGFTQSWEIHFSLGGPYITHTYFYMGELFVQTILVTMACIALFRITKKGIQVRDIISLCANAVSDIVYNIVFIVLLFFTNTEIIETGDKYDFAEKVCYL